MGLTGKEISNFFKRHPQIDKYFLGVFFVDQIPKIPVHFFCIVNTASSTDETQVAHWFAVCRYSKKRYECFDSLGTSEKYLQENLQFSGKVSFNSIRLQPKKSILCGAYAVTFLLFRCLNPELDFEEILNSYFYSKPSKNESHVTKIYRDF